MVNQAVASALYVTLYRVSSYGVATDPRSNLYEKVKIKCFKISFMVANTSSCCYQEVFKQVRFSSFVCTLACV